MPSLRLHNLALVTAAGPERGPLTSWEALGFLPDADLVLTRDAAGTWRTTWLGPADSGDRPSADRTLDCGGRLVVPGLCDSHTHAVFAGDRAVEFNQRLAGRSYADIAASGGGINHTVAATRRASLEELVTSAASRLSEMCAWGVRVVEVKTGYGLDVATEVRSLQAIAELRRRFAGRLRIVATAMPGHAIPPEFKGDPQGYVTVVCDTILPAMAACGVPVQFLDTFIERGYFDTAAAQRMAAIARGFGWGVKAHVDEFADIGGLAWAVDHRATSVEHLLCTGAEGIARLAASDTVAVCLPLTSVFLREPLAPMRELVDAGARVAVATDCNPGSAMTTNLLLAMQMAVLMGRLTPQEALRGVTRNAALALGEPGGWRGRVAVGEPFEATAFALGRPDELFYRLGLPPCVWTPLNEAISPALAG